MAYSSGRYNPDALPAHAEPDQAAQLLHARPSNAASHPPPRDNRAPSHTSPVYSAPPPQPDPRRASPRYHQPPPPSAPPPAPPAQYGGPPGRAQGYGHSVASPPPPPPPPPQQAYGQYAAPRAPTARPESSSNGGAASRRDALWPLFLQVDLDRSGQLSEAELKRALVNGDYTAFDPHTVRMMIRMFDTDRSGSINFDEFCGLWEFLEAWRGLFDRFDADRSGAICESEFENALRAFGYTLRGAWPQLLFHTYARAARGRGDALAGREKVLSFDLFVQACISLKRMTDVFKRFDEDRDGYITLSFEQFLSGAHGLFLFNSISPQTDTGIY